MDEVIAVFTDLGEVGIDPEASPGNGSYYVKLYDGTFDECGYDTLSEALGEMCYFRERHEREKNTQ